MNNHKIMKENKNTEWDDFLIQSNQDGNCSVCGKKTQMIDITFETYVCSTKCSQLLWNEYMKATYKIKTTH